MTTVLDRVARRSVGSSQPDLPLSAGFIADFGELVRSHARALFLYGLEDAEYLSFRVAERQLIQPLAPAIRARFDVEVWPGTVHGFLEMNRQRETFARALRWIEALRTAVPVAAGTARDPGA